MAEVQLQLDIVSQTEKKSCEEIGRQTESLCALAGKIE